LIVIRLRNIIVDNGLQFKKGLPAEITVSGHAGGLKGGDIVCSAVSALAQTLVLSIERLLDIKQNAVIENGFLSSAFQPRLNSGEGEKLKLLIESFLIGVLEVQKEYPERIKIDIEVD